jgi:L-threonylcarbamoyladenylate synthase
MKVFEPDPTAPDPGLIREIAALLKKGGIIAYPTDTLYGLGGDAFNPDAIHRIRILKGREGTKPFPYIIDNARRLADWNIRLRPDAAAIAKTFWPGPVSLVVEDAGTLPSEVVHSGRTICVRVPANRIARAITNAVGGLLIATSANPSGHASARTAQEAIEYFKGEIEAVVDGGPMTSELPSTIVDVTGGTVLILREGAIPADQIMAAVTESRKRPSL